MMRPAIYAGGEKKFGEKSSKSEGLHSVRESRTPVKPFKNLEEFKHVPKDEGGLGHKPRGKAMRRD